MIPRPKRVYWISRPDGKDFLVFDGGHAGGSIHVYEHRESHTVKDIEESVRVNLGWDELPPAYASEAAVARWIESGTRSLVRHYSIGTPSRTQISHGMLR